MIFVDSGSSAWEGFEEVRGRKTKVRDRGADEAGGIQAGKDCARDEPRVAVVIASREDSPLSAQCAKNAGVPCVVVVGNDPARQRNEGAAGVEAEVLWFVDDDTEFSPETVRCGLEWFRDPAVVAVGGPCPPNPNRRLAGEQAAVYAAMSSWLAYGPSRARYVPAGRPRAGDESLLIGSNLMVRALTFRAVGGFPEGLFPNEENLLMDRLGRIGTLMYDPRFAAYREPPSTLAEYFGKVRKYGGGRWRQFGRDRTLRNLLKVAMGIGSLLLAVVYPVTAGRLGGAAARAIHGTHFAYVAGILKAMGSGPGNPRGELRARD